LGNENDDDDDVILKLPVRKSMISSVEGGIARLHSSHMDVFEDENEEHMVVLRHEKKNIVVRIVSDRLAPKDTITLRSGDMDDLDVKEGDMIEIEPYHKLTDELKETWNKFISRFKRKDEEEGGD
jgi:hypothetical protein